MAEERDESQERNQPPTPRRLEELRERGQVPRSQDLGAAGVLVAAAFAVAGFAPLVTEHLLALMRAGFTAAPRQAPEDLFALVAGALGGGVVAIAPFLVVVAVAAFFSSIALGGWVLSAQTLELDWSKIDPIQGLKRRVFSLRGLAQMLKAGAKFLVVATVAVVVLVAGLEESLALAQVEVDPGIVDAALMLGAAFAAMCGAMLLIAAVDVPFQRWNFTRQNRMSLAEVKRELRNEEGAPELRAKVRARQREVASRRMMQAVATADVVITNPTHYACALHYDDADARAAPRLVASGADLVSWQIRRRARAHGVPVVEAPALARAIYHSTQLGQEVPVGLYAAVAIVLKYAYRLRGKRGFENAPEPPAELPIPAELQAARPGGGRG